ncbi:MAG: DUF4386 family protein [Actinophytocola sp.]|nr:DUF4386 family protein [Actinophytocola sp.]
MSVTLGPSYRPNVTLAQSENLWGVGNVFFGLWLIPMGLAALRSGWTPRPLGWVLIAGGVGYVLSAFVRYLVPSADPITQVLIVPATIGEFWMIGWLLALGGCDVRPDLSAGRHTRTMRRRC